MKDQIVAKSKQRTRIEKKFFEIVKRTKMAKDETERQTDSCCCLQWRRRQQTRNSWR